MDFDRLAPLVIGAVLGATGWLIVGLFMTRRANDRSARNAARAVYFELVMNEIDIDVAAHHSVYATLRRGAFDRLLPELATWLEADELEIIVRAYMSHAGYEQAEREKQLPDSVRKQLLARVLTENEQAAALLRRRAFSAKEAARLTTTRATREATEAVQATATEGARHV